LEAEEREFLPSVAVICEQCEALIPSSNLVRLDSVREIENGGDE
jgi:hypothetical protein